MLNHRFVGAWELVRIERRHPDGSVTVAPGTEGGFGMLMWTASGHFCSLVVGRYPGDPALVSYTGVAEAEDAVEGTLHHRVLAASVERLQADQVRHFRFDGADGLELSTPPDPDGAVPTLVWRRRTRDT